MSRMNNIDDVLVKAESDKLDSKLPPVREETESEPVETHDESDNVSDLYEKEVSETPKDMKNEEAIRDKSAKNDDKVEETDDYGNKVGDKPKLYTDEDVQRMIRERLKRTQQHEQTQNQPKEEFKPDANSEDSWEVQLEQFIDRTIEKRTQKNENIARENRERQIQAEFESRFTSGISRYNDFESVVGGKPFTPDMMLAVRSMEDPSAFVYAAAKIHPEEVKRISEIQDPYQQMLEVGRLDEKMRKGKVATSAKRPLSKVPSGDMVDKRFERPSIDDRIRSYSNQKYRR